MKEIRNSYSFFKEEKNYTQVKDGYPALKCKKYSCGYPEKPYVGDHARRVWGDYYFFAGKRLGPNDPNFQWTSSKMNFIQRLTFPFRGMFSPVYC